MKEEDLDAPSTDEHANRYRGRLNGSCNAHDRSTKEHRASTTKTISHVGRNGVGQQGANVLNGVEQAQFSSPWIAKVVVPLSDRLQTVHHTPIETICRRSDEQKENP